jgi:GNAT superfamily N-acetyltransferase
MGDGTYDSLGLPRATQLALLQVVKQIRNIIGELPLLEKAHSYDYYHLYRHKDKKLEIVAGFSMTTLPGNCGVVVFHSASVRPEFRRKGLGRLLLEVRINAAKLAGYSVALATTKQDNNIENKLLRSTGWTPFHDFTNARTSNKILMWMKTL